LIYSPQQLQTIEKLIPLTRLATSGLGHGMAVRPRTHSLIAGPSGMGKSHLVRRLAIVLELPLFEICVSTWMVLGGRCDPTWENLARWLNGHTEGIIFIDELDKISSPNEWSQHLRLEIHDLLDGRIPIGIKIMGDNSSESVWEENEMEEIDARNRVRTRLESRMMIIGAGAWQSAWTTNRSAIGYQILPNTEPSRSQFLESISAEILQRFRSEVLFMNALNENDYRSLGAKIAGTLPKPIKRSFIAGMNAALPQAVEGQLGMRIFEEILADALVDHHLSAAPPMTNSLEIRN